MLKLRNVLKNALLFKSHKINQRCCYSIKSKIPDTPITKKHFDEYIWDNLDKWHDKTAIECMITGRSYTYLQVYKQSRVLAHFLHQHPGLRKGDTVAVILPNVPEYLTIFLAIVQAGYKATTVNSAHNTDEIEQQLLKSEAKFVFTSTELYSKVVRTVKSPLVPIVTLNSNKNHSTPAGAIKLEELLNGDQELDVRVHQTDDDEVFLPYSSGTTGFPKTISLTNRNFTAAIHNLGPARFKLQRKTNGNDQDAILVLLPMFHLYGLFLCSLNALTTGTKIVTAPKFTTETFIEALERYNMSLLFVVPTLAQLLVNHDRITYNHLSNVRNIICGAAPLRTEDLERLEQKSKGGINLLQAYGLSESFGLVTHQMLGVPNGVKSGGSGIVIPNMEAKIISIDDDLETELGANQAGEIVVKGSQVMKGYYNDPEATKSSFTSDGWLKTGDIGFYDEDEQFFITDRIKDLIKVKGFQVAPAELEAILRTHPDVEDVGVIGVPHAKFGEVPKAFVVTKNPSKLSNIKEYVAQKVSSYKQLLGGVVAIDSIPKNPSGKILRRQLRGL